MHDSNQHVLPLHWNFLKISTKLFSNYSRDPINKAARLTIFQIFSFVSLLIEPACLTILTKSSTLIANQVSKYECFLSILTDFALI